MGDRLSVLVQQTAARASAVEWFRDPMGGSGKPDATQLKRAEVGGEEERGGGDSGGGEVLSWFMLSHVFHSNLVLPSAIPHHPVLPFVAPVLALIDDAAVNLAGWLSKENNNAAAAADSAAKPAALELLLRRAAPFACANGIAAATQKAAAAAARGRPCRLCIR